MTHTIRQIPRFRHLIFSLLPLVVMVTGCTSQDGLLPSYKEDDLRERHLMKQQTTLQKLTVIPIGPQRDQINPNDADRITSFVESYKLSGLDRLIITYYNSKAAEPAVAAQLKSLNETRTTTKTAGTKSGPVEIVFSYAAIQTVLDRNCDGRRTDGGLTFMVPNKTMGCAFTAAFAQQVAEPRDLVEPRQQDKKYYKSTIIDTTNSTNPNSTITNPIINPN
jgi:pilus biogenesis lipoprotein CpaD